MEQEFWQVADALLAGGKIVIDRPAGSRHPQWPDSVYPLDYGYVAGTSAMDGEGVDLWRGTAPVQKLDGLLVSVDLLKRDVEIKLLLGCMPEEKVRILAFMNRTASRKVLLVER